MSHDSESYMANVMQLQDALRELGAVMNVLHGDAMRAIEDEATNQYSARNAVRAIFAFIEGTTAATKRYCLQAHRVHRSRPPEADLRVHRHLSDSEPHSRLLPLTAAEESILAEVTYELTDNGGAIERTNRGLRFPANVRFMLVVFARTQGYAGAIDFSGEDWRAFQEAVKIRNRITHPRTTATLELSEQERQTVARTYRWYWETMGAIISTSPPIRA